MKNSIKKYFRIIILIIALLAMMFLMVWGRAYYGSMRDYQKAESFLKDQKHIRAITYFDRAIHWYTPFNPYIQKSAEDLWEIGEQSEKKGDIKMALIAYRTIRRGFYSARSFYQPGKNWLERCEAKIGSLMTKEKEERSDFDLASTNDTGELFFKKKRSDPVIFWSLIVEIGFLGWIGSVIGFIMLGIGRREEHQSVFLNYLIWILVIIIFFTAWIIGMVKA